MKAQHIILLVLAIAIAIGAVLFFTIPHKLFAAYIPKVQQIEVVDMIVYPDKATMKYKIAVINDGPVEALLDSVSYKVYFDTIEFSSGSQKFDKHYDKDGNDTLTLPLSMSFDKLDAAFESFKRKDSTDLRITFLSHFRLPIIGAYEVPMEVAVRMPSLIRPEVKVVNVDLTKFQLIGKEFGVRADIMLINKNNIAFKTDSLKLFMSIPGCLEGNIIHTDTIEIKAKDSSRISIPVEINELKIVKTAWKFLFDKEELEYIVTGNMNLILPIEQAEKVKVKIKTNGLTPFAGGKEEAREKGKDKK
ncbi:MAG: hypothetical protein SFW35_00385 [Chitinophagales bacterium]|nr:hypothetical protein [Chitinophagales bacterium]